MVMGLLNGDLLQWVFGEYVVGSVLGEYAGSCQVFGYSGCEESSIIL